MKPVMRRQGVVVPRDVEPDADEREEAGQSEPQ